MKRGRIALILALFCLRAGHASAEVLLQAVSWQLAKSSRHVQFKHQRGGSKIEEIFSLKLEGPKPGVRVRMRLKLANRGPSSVEGILLKYSMSARISSGADQGEGAWAVPFLLDERRVPKVGSNETKEIILDPSLVFGEYLRRIFRAGYAVKAVKAMIMVEPRPGETRSLEILESLLPVEN